MSEHSLREAICEIGRRLHDRGFVAAWDGNISARLGADRFLCTPTMCSKGRLRPEELAIVDATGRQCAGPRARTSEILLHLAIFRHRPEVQAVVHTHAPHATAFAITGQSIPNGVMAEVEFFLGVVPTVPYLLPGTAAFAESVVPHLDRTWALLLANHGVVTLGRDLEEAWGNMEILDAYCRILLLARPLGPVRTFEAEQLAELLRAKQLAGYVDPRHEDPRAGLT